jgi:hypothetical protein
MSTAHEGPAAAGGGSTRVPALLRRAVALVAGLFFLVGALQLLKTGAASLDMLQDGSLLVENPLSTLGLGWLGAILLLSGSPVAATALALVAAGEGAPNPGVTELEGFTMLTGSRLGAAFVVLLVAVVYALRSGRGKRRAPVSTAVLALTATAVVYVPAAFLGAALLSWGPFASLELGFPGQLVDLIDLVYGGIVERADESLPSFVVFLAGLGALLVAFKLIDAALPDLDDASVARRPRWLSRKWPMFGLGCAVALVTMSVSVALTILVPLVAKNVVRREHVLPYIMGANITTLGDTMFVAFALDSPAAVRIVLAEVIAAGTISVLILAFAYPLLWTALWETQAWVTRTRARLALFTGAVLLVPLAIIALGAVVG